MSRVAPWSGIDTANMIMTPRRCEWLQLRADGRTAAECANRMNISTSGERMYEADTMFILGAKTVTHAVAIGMRQGLIQ
jgi:DNA-binding CsgD family transcriptional regulator